MLIAIMLGVVLNLSILMLSVVMLSVKDAMFSVTLSQYELTYQGV
jgi:hypothetical protein